jgi:hypothetical protein
MTEPNALVIRAQALGLKEQEAQAFLQLTAKEQKALCEYREQGLPPLAPKTALGFYSLFLSGRSTEQIHELNRAFAYGAIVDARLRYGWDSTKTEYLSSLQSEVHTRMIQTQMESVGFIADVVSATHKKYGGKIAKYLQTGDESELDGFDLTSLAQYGKAIENLLKVTGQDQTKKVKLISDLPSGTGPTGTPKTVSGTTESLTGKSRLSDTQAAKILAVLAGDDDEPGGDGE